jgi:transcriptional regulator with XRE-family HTH domain
MGITLRSLAKNIGMSPSFLSQVESGKAVPSVPSLKKIADALNTSIGTLVGENDNSSEPVVRFPERRCIDDSTSSMKISFLSNTHPDKLMEPMLFTLKKKTEASENRYQHYGQEFVLVLKGRIEVVIKDVRYKLDEGDSIYFNSSIPHAFWSIHEDRSEVLSINTPPNF